MFVCQAGLGLADLAPPPPAGRQGAARPTLFQHRMYSMGALLLACLSVAGGGVAPPGDLIVQHWLPARGLCHPFARPPAGAFHLRACNLLPLCAGLLPPGACGLNCTCVPSCVGPHPAGAASCACVLRRGRPGMILRYDARLCAVIRRARRAGGQLLGAGWARQQGLCGKTILDCTLLAAATALPNAPCTWGYSHHGWFVGP